MAAYRWQEHLPDTAITRRRFMGTAAGSATALSLAAAGLVACSSSNNKSAAKASVPIASQSAAPASAAPTRVATVAPAGAGVRTATPAALDSTTGKPGGTLKYMLASYPAGFTVLDQSLIYYIAGLIYSGLLGFKWGVESVPWQVFSLEPDLAQAMPEQPDDTTYVYKLRPAKFHNGRTVTSQDVAYTYDRYTNAPNSYYSSQWKAWFDHAETPDPQTVVVKSKFPYADSVEATAANTDGFILAKEFEEGPDATNKMVGSGPYVFSSAQPPISVTLNKNPDYYLKPYPYFDQVQLFASPDVVARTTNFTSKQVNMPWVVFPIERDQIKQARPDAKYVEIKPYVGNSVSMRTDQPPFNDKRVRQALSMAIDRKAIRDAASKGEGEEEQFFTVMLQNLLGTSKVKDLGAAAKNWNFDPQAAKQLMTAAGIDKPIESQLSHYNATVIGQQYPDTATLMEAHWKQAGIANVQDISQPAAVFNTGAFIGKYDGLALNVTSGLVALNRGANLRNELFWGPSGEHSPFNVSYINDAELNQLVQKQIGQFKTEDRQQTFRQMEAILAEQQYYLHLSTTTQAWFYDPTMRNVAMSCLQGSRRYAMKWWFA